MKDTFDLELAFYMWRQDFAYPKADKVVTPFLQLPNEPVSWLRLSRLALLKSSLEIAKRLRISQQSYTRLEQREEEGRATIEHLRRAAEAMDCELIYAIRPKTRKTYSQTVWDELLKEILPQLGKRPHLPHMRGHVLAALAREAMENPRLMKKLRLTRPRS